MGLVTIKTPGGASFQVDEEHAPKFQGFLSELEGSGYGINGKESGGYNYRKIAGTNKLSNHAHGAAIDLNWNANARGTPGNLPANVQELAARHGLEWGGRWKNPDPMHFQVAGFQPKHNHAEPSASPNVRIAQAMTGQPTMTDASYSGETPETAAWKMKLAEKLIAGNTGAPTAGTGWAGGLEALARVMNSYTGHENARQAMQGTREGKAAVAKAMQEALTNGGDMAQSIAAGMGNPWGAEQFAPMANKYLGTRMESQSPEGRARAEVLQGQAAESRNRLQLAPEELKLKQEQNAQTRALLPLQMERQKVELEALKKKDALSEMIAKAFAGDEPPAATAPPAGLPAPTLPVSPASPLAPPTKAPPNIGPSLQTNPDGFNPEFVRPMADGAPQAPTDQSAPRPQNAGPTIRVGNREMSVEAARKLSLALAMGGKDAAAKMIEKQIEQSGLDKHTQGKVGEKAFNTGELSARLDGIAAKFKPEYQTMDMQAKMYGVSWMDSVGPLRDRIPQQIREQFKDYTAYRQEAIDNLSNYIKEITGAAMGIQEEKRIRMGMPDPVKDSPDQFQAKLENSLKMTKAALARHNYLISQGYDPKALGANREKIESLIKIDDMPRIYNQRGAELKHKIMSDNPQADAGEVTKFVAQRLKQEFGI